MEPMETQNKPNSSRTIIYIIIVIIVLLGLWWILAKDGGFGGKEEVTEISPGQTLRRAADGDLVSGFPEELILEDGVVADESFSINYTGAGIDQPVVTYTSSWTLEQNIEEYGTYLRENGWQVSHEASAEEDVTFFYAKKGMQETNITFNAADEEAGVVVTIAVATKSEVADTEEDTTSSPTETEGAPEE